MQVDRRSPLLGFLLVVPLTANLFVLLILGMLDAAFFLLRHFPIRKSFAFHFLHVALALSKRAASF